MWRIDYELMFGVAVLCTGDVIVTASSEYDAKADAREFIMGSAKWNARVVFMIVSCKKVA